MTEEHAHESGEVSSSPSDHPRLTYSAGMSLTAPHDALVARPQGIDSTILHISGRGYEIVLDDYGSYSGGGDRTLGSRSAKMTERRSADCRERLWEVELPTTNPAMRICPSADARPDDCREAKAHANLRVVCTDPTACRTADDIVASVRFSPPPWPRLPMPDPNWRPPPPTCEM